MVLFTLVHGKSECQVGATIAKGTLPGFSKMYIYEPVTKGHDLKWDTLP